MKNQCQELFGQVQKNDSLAGFNFTETVYPKKLRLPFHSHDFAYFCFVLGGNFTENVNKTEHLYQSSTVVYHPLGEAHSDKFHTASRCFNVRLNSHLAGHLRESESKFNQTVIQNNVGLNHLTTRLYQEFYDADEFSALTVEGLMLEIIAEFLRNAVKVSIESLPKWLLRARDFIAEEFKNELTIGTIATTVKVHPTHLAREFRRYFQITIGDFIRQRRIEFACQKIVNSKAPLSEISLEAGFYDQSHFTRIFRKATNMTPAAYRANYQNR